MFVTPKQASKHYNVSTETLRLWSENGKINFIKTEKGHRRYEINIQNNKQKRISIIYARVSSKKQEEDLNRQILFLQQKYPTFELITDIGSGINFKRKGLKTLLDKLFNGVIKEIVVAHKDRLTIFGFELFEFMCKKFNTKLTVVEEENKSPIEDLSEDLFSIITVFTTRYNGIRKYELLSEN
jgi:predicted site-specific integrase-resolvase